MRTRALAVLFALPFLVSAAAAERYEIDPVHSSATFRVKHLFSYVDGRFNDFRGSITGDAAKPEETEVTVDIKTASVDTHEPKRDEHLRSPEFFNAEEYPDITFKSNKVNITGNDSAFVSGDLTMHGVTKEVILQVKFLGKGPGAEGKVHTGWEARTALKRSDFGLTWSKTVEGTQLVGDDIEINLEIDAIQADDATAQAEAGKPTEPNTAPTGNLSQPASPGAKPLPPGTVLPTRPEPPQALPSTPSAPPAPPTVPGSAEPAAPPLAPPATHLQPAPSPVHPTPPEASPSEPAPVLPQPPGQPAAPPEKGASVHAA